MERFVIRQNIEHYRVHSIISGSGLVIATPLGRDTYRRSCWNFIELRDCADGLVCGAASAHSAEVLHLLATLTPLRHVPFPDK